MNEGSVGIVGYKTRVETGRVIDKEKLIAYDRL
jgi:hypothetical protein